MAAERALGGAACLAAVIAVGCVVPQGAAAPADRPSRGERLFQQCYACHSVDPGEDGLTGPNLRGVVGRRMAADREFRDYSPALRRAEANGRVWSAAELHRFLIDPEAAMPGTTMGYVGMADADDRADLIAWLRER